MTVSGCGKAVVGVFADGSPAAEQGGNSYWRLILLSLMQPTERIHARELS